MRRREMIATTGIAGLAALAGCTSPLAGGSSAREDLRLGDAVRYWNATLSVTDAVATERLRDDEHVERAPAADVFVLVHVVAENETDERVAVPVVGLFDIVAEQGTYHRETNVWRELRAPVEGELYRGESGAPPGATIAGWVDFVVDADATGLEVWIAGSERGDTHTEPAVWNLPELDRMWLDGDN